MPKDLFDKIEQTITTTGKAAAKKAKIKNDIRVAKRELNDLYEQVGRQYFESHMDYPEAEYIDLFNLIEKIRGDIKVMEADLEMVREEES